jgi:hypothetical protein
MSGLDGYRWHCFAGTETHAGAANDSRTAEQRLITEYRHVVEDGAHAAAA